MIIIPLNKGLLEKIFLMGIPIEYFVILGTLFIVLYLIFWTILVIIPVILVSLLIIFLSKNDKRFIEIYVNNLYNNHDYLGH